MYRAAVLLVCISTTTLTLRAQDSTSEESARWFDASTGLGAVTDLAYTFTGEFRLREGHQLLSFQLLYSREIQWVFFLELPPPREQTLNISVLYGRTYSFHLLRMLFPFFPLAAIIHREADYSISGSIGVGGSWNNLRGKLVQHGIGSESRDVYAEERKLSLGIPLQVEIVQYVTPSIGYVHRFYYNFGRERDIWGFLWGVQIKV